MSKINYLNDEQLKNWWGKQSPENVVIIDIRNSEEYQKENIKSSRNISADHLLKTKFSAEDENKIALFHCQIGMRSKNAEAIFLQTPFKEKYCLEGGLDQWKRCGLPTEGKKDKKIDEAGKESFPASDPPAWT